MNRAADRGGQQVINEVIADLGGLQLSLDLAEKEKDFNYDLFFRTLAGKFYRRFMTKEEALDYYSSDPHPAMYIRINFVCAQFEELYRTWPSIAEGNAHVYRSRGTGTSLVTRGDTP